MAQRPTPRERMVTSAIQLFRERGIAATALSDVIAHSQAPRGSLYHYFPGGKSQLATEATQAAGHLMNRMIIKSMARLGPAGTITKIVDLFRAQLRDSDYTSGCPVAAGALAGGGPPAARAAAGEAFATWESTLAAALHDHGFPTDRARSLATLAVCAIEGAIIVAKARHDTTPLDRVEAELITRLRRVD